MELMPTCCSSAEDSEKPDDDVAGTSADELLQVGGHLQLGLFRVDRTAGDVLNLAADGQRVVGQQLARVEEFGAADDLGEAVADRRNEPLERFAVALATAVVDNGEFELARPLDTAGRVQEQRHVLFHLCHFVHVQLQLNTPTSKSFHQDLLRDIQLTLIFKNQIRSLDE